ncbi:MAG: hypothetical protein HYR84_03260 [Planctomycetes bacterium]|nr:hypothetical protein [Planctomycetota bacterium]
MTPEDAMEIKSVSDAALEILKQDDDAKVLDELLALMKQVVQSLQANPHFADALDLCAITRFIWGECYAVWLYNSDLVKRHADTFRKLIVEGLLAAAKVPIGLGNANEKGRLARYQESISFRQTLLDTLLDEGVIAVDHVVNKKLDQWEGEDSRRQKSFAVAAGVDG